MIVNLLSWILLIGGGLLVIISAIGLLRLPDVFTRFHATGIADTLGASLIIFGLLLQTEPSIASVKLIMILLFLLFTGPTAIHAIAKAAIKGGFEPKLGGSKK